MSEEAELASPAAAIRGEKGNRINSKAKKNQTGTTAPLILCVYEVVQERSSMSMISRGHDIVSERSEVFFLVISIVSVF